HFDGFEYALAVADFFEQCFHRVRKVAHRRDAHHARAALEGVQVALQRTHRFDVVGRAAQNRQRPVAGIQQFDAFFGEELDQFGIESRNIQGTFRLRIVRERRPCGGCDFLLGSRTRDHKTLLLGPLPFGAFRRDAILFGLFCRETRFFRLLSSDTFLLGLLRSHAFPFCPLGGDARLLGFFCRNPILLGLFCCEAFLFSLFRRFRSHAFAFRLLRGKTFLLGLFCRQTLLFGFLRSNAFLFRLLGGKALLLGPFGRQALLFGFLRSNAFLFRLLGG